MKAGNGFRSLAVFWMSILAFYGSPSSAQDRRADESVSAAQAIACINAAAKARAGRIKKLEIDRENDKTVCEVEILARDGKKYEVYVDMPGGKVIRNVENR